MKRTISEVIELIKQKKESAEIGYIREKKQNHYEATLVYESNLEAYTDVLSLLKTSHLVEQEKALEILKKAFDISIEKTEKGVFVLYRLVTHKRGKYLSPEEYELLNEVFKDNE